MGSYRPLKRGQTYHIYNRGNNRENLFRTADNYTYFLGLVSRYIGSVADIYAYCLLRNHFHLLLRLHTDDELELHDRKDLLGVQPSQQLGNCFNAYTKAANPVFGRTGCLFQRPFGRRHVRTSEYFVKLILYIHLNPQSHGLADHFDEWPHSSYELFEDGGSALVKTEAVTELFGGLDGFRMAHKHASSTAPIAEILDGEGSEVAPEEAPAVDRQDGNVEEAPLPANLTTE